MLILMKVTNKISDDFLYNLLLLLLAEKSMPNNLLSNIQKIKHKKSAQKRRQCDMRREHCCVLLFPPTPVTDSYRK